MQVHRESSKGDAVQLNVVQDTSHFRASAKLPQAVGKTWGPWLWYLVCTSSPPHSFLLSKTNTQNNGSLADAQHRASLERKTYPYAFFRDTVYHSRGALKGSLVLSDGRPASGAAVFLGDTDTSIRPLIQGTNSYYTTYADATGSFSFEKVRSGKYGLYASSNGGSIGDVYTNFTLSPVNVEKGETTSLEELEWSVPQNHERIFQIGAFDKKSTEFKNGGAVRQHGLTEQGPANLTFVVGESQDADWYYASSKLGSWDVVFNTTRPSSSSKALLTVSLAGYSQSTQLGIYLNGNTTVGSVGKANTASDPALYRSGTTSGEGHFLQYEVRAEALREGKNVLSFVVERYTLWRGVMWDSVVLEWVD
jgi:rhamnogalacturonan endolyase